MTSTSLETVDSELWLSVLGDSKDSTEEIEVRSSETISEVETMDEESSVIGEDEDEAGLPQATRVNAARGTNQVRSDFFMGVLSSRRARIEPAERTSLRLFFANKEDGA